MNRVEPELWTPSRTLVGDLEARFVLGVVAVEEEARLVGGAEHGLGHLRAAEAVDHRARLQVAAADLQVVVDGLRGEVEELQVDAWGETGKHLGLSGYTLIDLTQVRYQRS